MFAAFNTAFSNGGLDPATLDLAAVTGATDLGAVDTLVRYVKRQNLWNNFLCYPMKAAQNFGSGLSVKGIGGYSSDAMTLIASPTWNADGINFNGSTTQYGTFPLTGWSSVSNLKVFCRAKPTSASAANTNSGFNPFAYGNYLNSTGSSVGSLKIFPSTGALAGETMASGSIVNGQNDTSSSFRRLGTSAYTWTAGEDQTMVWDFATTGTGLYKNTSSTSLSLGNQITSSSNLTPQGLGSTATSMVCGGDTTEGVTTGRHVGEILCFAVLVNSSATSTQRAAITNLINAL